jgi:hypothetical protein
MPKLTKVQRIIKGLLAMGAVPVPAKTTKYKVFYYKPYDFHYFVGRSAALRFSREGTSPSKSIPVSPGKIAEIMAEGETHV